MSRGVIGKSKFQFRTDGFHYKNHDRYVVYFGT